jgi:uncharacterized protein YktB (UPF0637 family)
MNLFNSKDFKVFDVAGFEERMAALRSRIQPKLAEIGEALVPGVAGLIDRPLHVHVAKHMRRTVNPPDDTWVALGADKRGYKKDVHFKIAVSRNCVRLLFELGPEYYDKAEWALKWKRDIRLVTSTLESGKKLAWFKDEHDEQPASQLSGWSGTELAGLGQEVTRRKNGHLVIGRRIDFDEFIGMNPPQFKRIAMATFRSVAPLFSIHEPRVIARARA